MKAIITGASGTVGQALSQHLQHHGWTIVCWDRSCTPVNDYATMENFVAETAPDAVFHLAISSRPTGIPNEGWLVNWHWPSELAWITRLLAIPFVFTSTVMVFTNDQQGPYTPTSQPGATEGYGGDKRRAEERIRFQNPAARIVRLGWQIGHAPGNNNMIDFLTTRQAQEGRIRASTRWLPACSFLEDTAEALGKLPTMPPGLYHLDGNRSGWNFFQIASALNQRHGGKWNVEASEDFVLDQRMTDPLLQVSPLEDRLPQLKA